MDFPKFRHAGPENHILHTFKKSVSLDETLKRMKRIQNFAKSGFFVFLIDFRGRSPGQLR